MTFQNLYFLHTAEFAQWTSPSVYGHLYERCRLATLGKGLRSDLHSADRIVAVSETARDDLMDGFNVSAEKIDVVYEAVGEPFTERTMPGDDAAVLKRLNVPPRYFLSVGAMAPNKNLPLLLKAYARLVSGESEVPALVIAGPDWHGFSRQLRGLAAELRVECAVHFIGFVDPTALAALYRCATATVQLSGCEAFGLPALEAMACGSPLIVSNRSGLSEIAGTAAVQVQPSDPLAVADALRRISPDSEWRRRWVERGRNHVRQFSWDKAARDTFASIVRATGWQAHDRSTEPDRSCRHGVHSKHHAVAAGA